MSHTLRKSFGSRWMSFILIYSVMGGIASGLVAPWSWASDSPEKHDGLEEDVRHITVHIENRRFFPHIIRLRVGEQTRLVLKNDDVELHAFVPTDLLAQTNVQVEGNGAPQFNKQGFHRVLLPSRGEAQLTFSPKQVGSYPFFCDLPGHVMNGTIVVED